MTVIEATDARVAPSALRPVFLTLRFGLHLLVVGLTLFVVVRALLEDAPTEVPVTILAVAFLAWYGAGLIADRTDSLRDVKFACLNNPVDGADSLADR